jgi:hypothetical protein
VPSFDTLEIVHVSVTVWGEKYLSLFLGIGVPNLCALVMELPEELRRRSRVRIFTAAEDLAHVENAAALGPLRRRISVDVVAAVEFKQHELYGGYAPMVVSQAKAVVDASRTGAAIIFMGPDLVFSSGSFKRFIDCARSGHRVVIGPSLRAIRETATPALLERIEASHDKVLDIPAEALTDLAFDHWHPVNDLFVWNSPQSVYWKAYLIYRIADDDVLMRFFQGPTFFAWPKRTLSEYRGWIDHSLVSLCCDRYDQIYVVADSAECISCDLMAGAHQEGMVQSRYREFDLLKEMLHMTTMNRFNIHYGFRTCRVHRASATDDQRQKAARRLAREIDPILKMGLVLRAIRRPIAIACATDIRMLFKACGNFVIRTLARLMAPMTR